MVRGRTDDRVLWARFFRDGASDPAPRRCRDKPPPINYGNCRARDLLVLLILIPAAGDRGRLARFVHGRERAAVPLHLRRGIGVTGNPRVHDTVSPAFQTGGPRPSLAFIVVFVMLFSALRRAWMRQTQGAIVHMAGTVLSTLYLGGLGVGFLVAACASSTRSARRACREAR